MKLYEKIVIWFVVLAVCIGAIQAIECHDCNSISDPRCGDPFDDFSISTKNCKNEKLDHLENLTATVCRKTVQKVYGKVRIVRGCGFITDERDDKECVKRSGTHDVQALYCACTTDFCNHGSSIILLNQKYTLGLSIVLLMGLYSLIHS